MTDASAARLSAFTVEVIETGTSVVVKVGGEFDLYAGDAVRTALTTAIDSTTSVIVDLSAVSFLDSTALGLLIAARKRALGRGCRFQLLVEAAPEVRRVLAITGLERVFETQ